MQSVNYCEMKYNVIRDAETFRDYDSRFSPFDPLLHHRSHSYCHKY